MIRTLPLKDYRAVYDPDKVDCTSTDKLEPSDEIIGQERAQKALHFGLGIQEKGFNIYVAGLPGTGRKTAVNNFLYELARGKPKADDWIYVNNFTNPYEPIAIRLSSGSAIQFKADMGAFIEGARRALPRAFESEDAEAKRQKALFDLGEERKALVKQANESAEKQGFSLQIGPSGMMIVPVIDGKPIKAEDFEALPEKTRDKIVKKREKLDVELRVLFRKVREIDVKGMETSLKLRNEIALDSIGPLLKDLEERYGTNGAVLTYIENVRKDILDNLGIFLGTAQPAAEQIPPQFQQFLAKDLAFRRYEVNIVVDNGSSVGAPVVFEETPSYQNLLGRSEKEVQFGVVTTDFMMI